MQLGEKLTTPDVKLVRWSRQSVPEGAFTDPSMVGNSYARNQLVAGQPIVQHNLIQADQIPGVMPMMITPGMRAMSVAVDDVGDISGFVKPRTRVDVLVATPGRLLDLIEQRHLSLGAVEILVVDEADQMLDLGFIVPLRKIVKMVPAKRQTLFFSATMPKTIANPNPVPRSPLVVKNGSRQR